MSTIASQMKRYSFPFVLFTVGLFFQLFVLPKSFPSTHYDVLGVKLYSSIEEVSEAYDRILSRWDSGLDTPTTPAFIQVRYAFELLTNPLLKRDYDYFGIDEHVHVIEKVIGQYDGMKFSDIQLPLLESSSDITNQDLNILTSETFISTVGGAKAILIQVYSEGSPRCAKFITSWKRIAHLLDGTADTGVVELGDVQLASYLAERKSTKQPFFRNGLPALVAFPPNCRSTKCYVRYQGDHVVDAVVDWMATDILGLPRILYYTKETLVPNFFAKSGQHKVKVILFSKTGERAAPFLRQAAKDYWSYASFALVLWREEDSSLWWNMFNVESAPAFVIIKDPGVPPVVHHGSFNSSRFLEVMESNKNQELPQLRSVTSMELGCDANGFSRAGNDTVTWYCVILAGRPSLELNRMRETMRKAKNVLAGDVNSDSGKDGLVPAAAASSALKENRLTLAWLDGEAQKKYCLYYLYSENIQETCGPRGYAPAEVPRVFIIRYKRNYTENELMSKRKANNKWNMYQENDANVASQLVARYNGTDDVQEALDCLPMPHDWRWLHWVVHPMGVLHWLVDKIITWISQIIEDGDTRELPYFIESTPELIPEDSNPIWTKSAQGVRSAGKGLKQRIQGIVSVVYDYASDPRIGPMFLLGACLSFGSIWLQGTQTTQPAQPAQPVQPAPTDESAAKTRTKTKNRVRPERSNQERPSSITDEEPKDAYQMLPSDSDSE